MISSPHRGGGQDGLQFCGCLSRWISLFIFACMIQVGSAGVADGDGFDAGGRQRNIFPLPKISGDSKSGFQDSNWEGFANAGIKALNELAGCSNSHFCKRKATRVQRKAIQHISDAYREAYLEADSDPGGSALHDLCCSSRLYQIDRSDVVSYAKESVSWPKVETSPVAIEECLSSADSERLATWRQHMLKPASDKDGEALIKKPYFDPILKHNRKEYLQFIRELYNRNMIRFKAWDGSSGDLGIFFVRKKNGSQRLIFDTRILNHKFFDPPSTDLPSADAFTRLETVPDIPFYVGSGDLANAFYTLGVPDDLARMFTLPAVEVESFGIKSVDGIAVRPGQRFTPYLTVLPMGWSWALHLCQSVMNHAIEESGVPSHRIISDKGQPVKLSNISDIACGGYVDNFLVVGCDQSAVDAGLAAIAGRLRGLGLTVHEEVGATHETSFVGLSFNGIKGTVGLKPGRILKLQKAIRELVERNFCSGELMQLILGHITWAVMTRREGLSILKSCYAFVHQNQSKACRLWPSVRWELQTIAALLPLFKGRINVGWSDDLIASDSSPFGYGVCHRKIQSELCSEIGSQSERWRFRFEDAVDARKHAAQTVGLGVPEKGVIDIIENLRTVDESDGNSSDSFHEVPIEVLDPRLWNVAWSRPWRFHDNILHTEALALVWSVEHVLRSSRNFGQRLLFLSDNLPLTLSASKGRGKSSFLTKPLRQLCAFALATGSKLHVRWIPSEWNVADRPSRALTQWGARGFDSWFNEEGERGRRSAVPSGSRIPEVQSSRKKVEKTTGGSRKLSCASKHQLSRGPECEGPNNQGLLPKVQRVSELDEPASALSSFQPGVGRRACGVSPGVIRPSKGSERWGASSGCSKISHGSSRYSHSSDNSGFERLASCSTTPTTNASADRGGGGHHWDLLAPTSGRVKSSIVHPVHDLHEARRMQCTVDKAIGGSSEILESGIHFLGGVTPSSRGSNPRQDRSVRQFSHHRLGRVDQPISDETGKRKVRDITFVDNQSQRVSKPVCSSIPPSQTAKSRSDTVCSETWRCNSRCAVKAEEHVGSEAERKVGNRHVIETIHQRGKIANRVKQGARSCQRVWSKDHAKPAAVVGQPVIDSADTVWNSSITKRMIGRAIKKNKGPRSLSGSSLLKKLFREALKNCNGKFHGVFLDIFSGDGGVSQHLKKRGFPVVSIDICDDPRFDVLDPAVVAVIVGWIKSKCVLGVWLATPCTSWSRARHGPVNSNWGPIRSNQFIYGFKNLSDTDLTKVTIGNKTMRFTAHIISNCIHFKTPCFLENPATSMLWRAPPIVKCCSHVSSKFFICDFCQYGARWRKRTKIQGWFVQDHTSLTHLCQGRKGICSRSLLHHIVLSGQDPVSKQLWTHLAQPYPKGFACAAANALIESYEAIHTFHLRRHFGI